MSADGLASPRSAAGPLQVLLNVYDVAQGDSKGTVVRLNNLVGPKGLGLGGEQLLTVAQGAVNPQTPTSSHASFYVACLSCFKHS